VQILLDHGAEIDATSGKSPHTPLGNAAAYNKRAVVRLLLQRGANVNLQTKGDDGGILPAPLHQATRRGLLQVVEILLEYKPDLELRDSSNLTPLGLACQHRDIEIAKRLLAAGADPKTKIDPLNSLLTTLVRTKRLPAAQLLIDNGARFEVQGKLKGTMLHAAVAQDDMETVEFLLKNNTEIGAKDIGGATPLMITAERDLVAIAHMLLEHGASVHDRDRHGNTALHIAAAEGSTEVASLLLENGLDPLIVSKRGYTAKGLAAQAGHEEISVLIVKSLESAGKIIYDPRWPGMPILLSPAALCCGYEIVDSDGRPVEHLTCQH